MELIFKNTKSEIAPYEKNTKFFKELRDLVLEFGDKLEKHSSLNKVPLECSISFRVIPTTIKKSKKSNNATRNKKGN